MHMNMRSASRPIAATGNSKVHLMKQSQLSEAGALADACQLLSRVIKDGEGALLNHIEHIPCATTALSPSLACLLLY